MTSQITGIFIYDTSVVRYLAAVSPPDIRGTIGACSQVCLLLFHVPLAHLLFQLAQTVGVFLGLLLGIPYEFDEGFRMGGYEWWRLMFLFASVPPMLQVIDMSHVPLS